MTIQDKKYSFKEYSELEYNKWKMIDVFDNYYCLEVIAKKSGYDIDKIKKILNSDKDFIKNERGHYKFIGKK